MVPLKAVATCNDEVLTESTDPLIDIEYVEISGVDANGGIVETTGTTFGAAPSRARRIVRNGDVLISTVRTYLRAIAQVPDAAHNLIASTGFAVLRPKFVLSSFLGHVCRSEYFIAEVIARSVGVSYPAINASQIMALTVPLPPLPEQQAIASFLDRETAKIDGLIEEQRRLIALLAEKRQATISHAVTRGLNPAARLKPSGVDWLGDIPEGWEVVPLKYLVTFHSGNTPSKERAEFWDGDIPWASAKDLKAERLGNTQLHISEAAISEGGAALQPAGSVVVLVRGMTLAKAFPVCLLTDAMAINQDLKALHCGPQVSGEFLAHALRGLAAESLSRIDEAEHGTKALRMDAWVSMEMPVPPMPEQRSIASWVDAETAQLDALTETAISAITLLQERRSALISAAVTGRIDVRGLAPAKAA